MFKRFAGPPYKNTQSAKQANRTHKRVWEVDLYTARKGVITVNQFVRTLTMYRYSPKKMSVFVTAFLRGFVRHAPDFLKGEIQRDVFFTMMQEYPAYFTLTREVTGKQDWSKVFEYLEKMSSKRRKYVGDTSKDYERLPPCLRSLPTPDTTVSRSMIDHWMYLARIGAYSPEEAWVVCRQLSQRGREEYAGKLYLALWGHLKKQYKDPREELKREEVEKAQDQWVEDSERILFEGD